MSRNAVAKWDFTLGLKQCGNLTFLEVSRKLKEFCKSGTFQLEEGTGTNYKHYQGRVSLKKKARMPPIDTLTGIHWSATSSINIDNLDYCTKEYSRLEGPWDITEIDPYIPRQIREISKLFDWQQSVINKLGVWDTRTINCIVDGKGNTGKSILVGWIRAHRLGRALPPVNDYKDLMRVVCDLPTARNYMIDMPRALKKDKLSGFFGAIESIKNGYAYDDRYNFTEKIFDSPNIWVFTNSYPDYNLLSGDRWRIWQIDEYNHLQPLVEEEFEALAL